MLEIFKKIISNNYSIQFEDKSSSTKFNIVFTNNWPRPHANCKE